MVVCVVFDEHQLYQRGRFQEFAVIVATSVGYASTPVNHCKTTILYQRKSVQLQKCFTTVLLSAYKLFSTPKTNRSCLASFHKLSLYIYFYVKCSLYFKFTSIFCNHIFHWQNYIIVLKFLYICLPSEFQFAFHDRYFAFEVVVKMTQLIIFKHSFN